MLTDNPILIGAAQKNYDKFLVPTSLVDAKKVVRHYTKEEQADLDIKTSVNKIGEINYGFGAQGCAYKLTHWIAGTPLESCHHNIRMKQVEVWRLENGMNWAISSEAPNRGTFNDYPMGIQGNVCQQE